MQTPDGVKSGSRVWYVGEEATTEAEDKFNNRIYQFVLKPDLRQWLVQERT